MRSASRSSIASARTGAHVGVFGAQPVARLALDAHTPRAAFVEPFRALGELAVAPLLARDALAYAARRGLHRSEALEQQAAAERQNSAFHRYMARRDACLLRLYRKLARAQRRPVGERKLRLRLGFGARQDAGDPRLAVVQEGGEHRVAAARLQQAARGALGAHYAARRPHEHRAVVHADARDRPFNERAFGLFRRKRVSHLFRPPSFQSSVSSKSV